MKTAPLPALLVASALFIGRSLSIILTDPAQLKTTTYDYIIVGAGTSGLALAARLSEDTELNILVLEAGVSDANVVSVMAPFLAPTVTPYTAYDWNYTVIPQAGMDNRTYPYPRGRLLGGTSSANYMVHQYGSNDNWDRMAKVTGDPGWAWNNMKRYVLPHEKFVIPPHDGHNTTDQFSPDLHSYIGDVDISLYVHSQNIDARVIETTRQLKEFPYNEDISGIATDLLGVGWAQSTMTQGARVSSSTSYLSIANTRPNLTILINAMVTKLINTGMSGGLMGFQRVQFTDGLTKTYIVESTKEVILSAGAIGTVQILQLSGIGDPADLNPLGISVIVDSPRVGKNLQDHPLLPNIFTVEDGASLDHILRNQSAMGEAINEWAVNRTGFISNNVVNNLAFARVKPEVLEKYVDPAAGKLSPHYELIFANYWLNPAEPVPPTGSYFTILTALLTPTSRGTVKIKSSNPFDAPIIDPNMLTTEWDVNALRESVRAAKRFAAAPAWDGYITGAVGKLFSETTSGLDAHAREIASTIFHPTSTASMSSYSSKNGVVNPDLTVKGTYGLRVVDLSVLPYIPSCHPQGPAYMIAERAADLIKIMRADGPDDLSPQYVLHY
ncbi:GMC oxidoreductase [Hypholoma sublateritium FD-334 SS-4]|uniref:pyranose dehydrogenase (acceptor) n=1 Tax=Hypholoma sublateritium (strain FD-334 SS-4) TaxID=945553 RepID=A0A0D2LSW5_HYPSF|nr:GMC oxidoreductase [Hypholoma sublateritium FD-334 SS-4]